MKRLTTATIALALLAGCAQAPTSVLRIDRDAATLSAYGVAQASSTLSTTTALVATTSIHNAYFDLSLLTDGKLSSAWGPAKADAAPSLQIDLDSATDLTKLGLKLSLGTDTAPGVESRVFVDVYADGAFVATFSPLEASPQLLDLDLEAVTRLKLRFRCLEGDISELLVCDLKLLDGADQEIEIGVALDQKLYADLDLDGLFDGVWGLEGFADLDPTLQLIVEASLRAGVSLEELRALIASCDDAETLQAELTTLVEVSGDSGSLDEVVETTTDLTGGLL